MNNKKIENSIQKARTILAHTLNVEKEYLIIHSEEDIEERVVCKYNENIDKLINHIPLQYITNYKEFMKLDFYVDENVLIPRVDTEILVEEVINSCKKNDEKKYKILDLCTGSGIVGISLAKYINNSEIVCADISKTALEIAKKNAKKNNVDNVKFIYSNMFSSIKDKFDIIVSNPPYIKRKVIGELQKEVQNEPNIALDGGEDGLDFYKIITNEAYKYLYGHGGLFLEIGYDQKEEVMNLLKRSEEYKDIYSKKDLCGNDRIVVAHK